MDHDLVFGLGVILVAADGDPERDGIGTNVRVELIDSTAATLVTANSSGAFGTPAPPAEAIGLNQALVGAFLLRVTRPALGPGGPGTYHITTRSSFECPASAELQSFEVE